MQTDTDVLIRLDDYLPFLVNRIGPRIEQGFAEPLARAGITLPMWRVMAILRAEGPQRLNDLGRMTSMPLSSTSRLVSEMVEAGLLDRTRSHQDGRAIRVALSTVGTVIAADVSREAEAYEARITRSMTAADTATLKRLLKRLNDELVSLTDTRESET
ncbi:MarR family winged helix-turn-helix transcriptional regulator [Minwuia sp.]|uniref:MarR family winged helix-turn-helix transcriptional regulator n=1 Tax=Minwuia sp. TaxID=2493630 RepID=UPI003A8F528C